MSQKTVFTNINLTGHSITHLKDGASAKDAVNKSQLDTKVGGTGTTGKLPKWASSSTLTDSIITEAGTLITIGGSLTINTTLTISSMGTAGFVKNNSSGVFSGGNSIVLADLPAITLDNLSDVVITTPATNDILKYNGTNWVNSASGGGGVAVLDDLTDVVITSPASGHILNHNGTNWVNSAIGSNTQLIFNNSGVLTGNSGLTWDNTNKRVTISGTSAGTSYLRIQDSANNMGVKLYTYNDNFTVEGLVIQNATGGTASLRIMPSFGTTGLGAHASFEFFPYLGSSTSFTDFSRLLYVGDTSQNHVIAADQAGSGPAMSIVFRAGSGDWGTQPDIFKIRTDKSIQTMAADAKLYMSSTSGIGLTGGMTTEVDGQLIDIGTNYNQLGGRNSSYDGGYFRVDTRTSVSADSLFTWAYHVASGSEAAVMTMGKTGNLTLYNYAQFLPTGTGAGNTGELRFRELAANGSNYVGFKAPDNISANKVWVLPNADGAANQTLKTDGSGNLGWVSPAKRSMVIPLCVGETPGATGGWTIFIVPRLNAASTTWNIKRVLLRTEVANTNTTTIQVEKSTASGAFSGSNVLSSSLSITGGSTYETSTTGFAISTIASGDKVRANFSALGASQGPFYIEFELEEA